MCSKCKIYRIRYQNISVICGLEIISLIHQICPLFLKISKNITRSCLNIKNNFEGYMNNPEKNVIFCNPCKIFKLFNILFFLCQIWIVQYYFLMNERVILPIYPNFEDTSRNIWKTFLSLSSSQSRTCLCEIYKMLANKKINHSSKLIINLKYHGFTVDDVIKISLKTVRYGVRALVLLMRKT